MVTIYYRYTRNIHHDDAIKLKKKFDRYKHIYIIYNITISLVQNCFIE